MKIWCVEAASALAARGPGSSRIAAPTDRSTASAVLADGGGTARLLAGAGSCTASLLAGAEEEAIGSELLRRPRYRATHARQSVDVCFLFILFARTPQNTAKKKTHTEHRTQNKIV